MIRWVAYLKYWQNQKYGDTQQKVKRFELEEKGSEPTEEYHYER